MPPVLSRNPAARPAAARDHGGGPTQRPGPRTAHATRTETRRTVGVGRADRADAARLHRDHLVQALKTGLPLAAVDAVAVLLAIGFAALGVRLVFPEHGFESFSRQVLAISGVIPLVFYASKLHPGGGLNPVFEFRQLVCGVTLGFALVAMANTTLGRLADFELFFLGVAWLLAAAFVPVARLTARGSLARRDWWGQRVLIVGAGVEGATAVENLLANPTLGLRPVGVIRESHNDDVADGDPVGGHGGSVGCLGGTEGLRGFALGARAPWAVVATDDRSDEHLTEVLEACSGIPNVVLLPRVGPLPTLWSGAREFYGGVGVVHRERLLEPVGRVIKRSMDLAIVGTLTVPALAAAAVIVSLIKWYSPGPAFFGHERIGRGGQRFKAWKFRSMVPDADRVLEETLAADPTLREEWEATQKLRDDPRVIPVVGRLLRKMSLDELPQLWNVVHGEMSLVGPRPIVSQEIARYGGIYPLYLKTVPGITGLWQISGRNLTTYEERVNLDAYYVRNWSPWLDLFILARTVKTVLLREGAF